MSSSTVDNSMRYCNKENIMCKNANSNGYCNVTACINNDDVKNNKNCNSMCENCRHGWSGRCDKSMNPLTCDAWEPD